MKRMEFFIEILQKTVSITPKKSCRVAFFTDKAENVVTVLKGGRLLFCLVVFDVVWIDFF